MREPQEAAKTPPRPRQGPAQATWRSHRQPLLASIRTAVSQSQAAPGRKRHQSGPCVRLKMSLTLGIPIPGVEDGVRPDPP